MRAVVAALLLAGCASAPPPPQETSSDAKVAALTRDLAALAPGAETEARLVAEEAVSVTARRAEEWRVAGPPLLHNTLVNLGLRDRGLCCDWARDLLDALESLPLERLDVQWGVAHHGSRIREHSSVVVTAAGAPFTTGIALDGWRNAGDLHWARVADDRYPWQPHPAAGPNTRIHCR